MVQRFVFTYEVARFYTEINAAGAASAPHSGFRKSSNFYMLKGALNL